MRWTRPLATAAIVGATTLLLADLLLQTALSLVRVDGRTFAWVTETLMDRGRWLAAAVIFWLAAPRLESALDGIGSLESAPRLALSSALRGIGVAMLAIPVVWTMAIVIVRAMAITLAGDWSIDGRVFASSYFYSTLVTSYAPWATAGVILVGIARHAPTAKGSNRSRSQHSIA